MDRSVQITAFTILLAVVFVVGTMPALAQQLEPRSLFDGKVSILIPAGFEPMSEEMLAEKYPLGEAPKLVFTNPDGSVNVAMRHTSMQVGPQDVPLVHQFVEWTFQRQFPRAVWFGSTTGERGGMPYFTLEFVTPADGTGVRNIMLGTALDGRMLLISFNCTRELEEQWAPLGQQIIDSISLTGG